MNIGYFGAEGHGKTTLKMAILYRVMKDGDNLVCNYPHHEEFLTALKNPEFREFVCRCLRKGGRVDLGCDPGMTPVGKELIRAIRDLEVEDDN